MSTNISKQKREELLNKIKEIRKYISSAPQDENTVNLLSYLSDLEKDVNGKKYGLVFEEHREEIDEILDTHTPVLNENKELFIDNGGQMNFLIEGDNLAALKLLEKTHKGKIDVIYVDPPYNTGNDDFLYDDKYVSKDDNFRHSKWLSFIYKRMIIAKRLLKPNGVIFLSIDKNEAFQLKLLMDEIFGEESCVADLHIETSAIAGPRRYAAINGSIVKTAEFVLGYVNGVETKIVKHPLYDYIPGFDTHYSLFYDYKNQCFCKFTDYIQKVDFVVQSFKKINLKISIENLTKVIFVDNAVRKWLYSKDISENLFRTGGSSDAIPKEIFSQYDENQLIKFQEKFYRKKGSIVNELFRYSDRIGKCDDYFLNFGERSIRGNLWKGFSADGGNLAKEGGVSFKNGKKPKRLVRQLLETVTDASKGNSFIVLDFFAGSGTTAEALLDINNDYHTSSSFILCTNNEIAEKDEIKYFVEKGYLDFPPKENSKNFFEWMTKWNVFKSSKKYKIEIQSESYQNLGICRFVTYSRMKNIITGKLKNGRIYSNGRQAKLKYYKIDYVPIDEKLYYEYADELLKHVRELVELENGINFIGNAEIAIAVTEEDLATFTDNIDSYPECRKLYMGHDLLPDSRQETVLREHNIEIAIIPDYYYRDLQER